jgi:hypothetical protein
MCADNPEKTNSFKFTIYTLWYLGNANYKMQFSFWTSVLYSCAGGHIAEFLLRRNYLSISVLNMLHIIGAHERGEKIVQGFGGKARRKETSWKTEA